MTVQVLDFYADWCGPCKTQDPILQETIDETEDVELVKVDVDEDQNKANEFQVRSLPTLVILKEGAEENEVSDRFVGVTQKEDILTAIENARQ